MFSNSRLLNLVIALGGVWATSLARADDEGGNDAVTQAEVRDTLANADRTDLLAPSERAKLEAETVKLYAEANRAVSEANLNEARRVQIVLEMERLKQRMRLTEYEFNRIVNADFEMRREVSEIEGQTNLVKPLMLGRSNWRTWVGLETLMMKTGDAAIIAQVMFEIPVPALPATDFIANSRGDRTVAFPGGNLGQLYAFARDHDLSFRQFGAAHQAIIKVLAMISEASKIRIRELRDINQAIRLTIANIQ